MEINLDAKSKVKVLDFIEKGERADKAYGAVACLPAMGIPLDLGGGVRLEPGIDGKMPGPKIAKKITRALRKSGINISRANSTSMRLSYLLEVRPRADEIPTYRGCFDMDRVRAVLQQKGVKAKDLDFCCGLEGDRLIEALLYTVDEEPAAYLLAGEVLPTATVASPTPAESAPIVAPPLDPANIPARPKRASPESREPSPRGHWEGTDFIFSDIPEPGVGE